MKKKLYMLVAAALLAVGGITNTAGRVTLKDLEAAHTKFKAALAVNDVAGAASILAAAKAGQLGKLYAGSLVGWQKQLDAARAAAPVVTRAPAATVAVAVPTARVPAAAAPRIVAPRISAAGAGAGVGAVVAAVPATHPRPSRAELEELAGGAGGGFKPAKIERREWPWLTRQEHDTLGDVVAELEDKASLTEDELKRIDNAIDYVHDQLQAYEGLENKDLPSRGKSFVLVLDKLQKIRSKHVPYAAAQEPEQQFHAIGAPLSDIPEGEE